MKIFSPSSLCFLLLGILVGISAAAIAADGGVLSGLVLGISDEPLPRAVIYARGTSLQTVTDESGRFTFDLPSGQTEVLIQALGYKEHVVHLGDQATPPVIRLEPAWPLNMLLANARQMDDPDFAVSIDAPAFPPGEGPVIFIDEGHHNAHTASRRYRLFADILKLDGYVVKPSGTALLPEYLDEADILVIATPNNGLEVGTLPARSAFSAAEIAGLREWVQQGGSLFLVSDHMPIPGAMENLLNAFGVHGLNGYVFEFDGDKQLASPMLFHRSDGSLRPHAVLEGRNPAERITTVATFTGFAFQAGDEFEPLLVLRGNAESLQVDYWFTDHRDHPRIPVGGWLQGAVGRFGQGRVALIGEAAMFTAQVRGADRWRNGLSHPKAAENQQFLLNIMHWLSGMI